jgi:hypothetical protein
MVTHLAVSHKVNVRKTYLISYLISIERELPPQTFNHALSFGKDDIRIWSRWYENPQLFIPLPSSRLQQRGVEEITCLNCPHIAVKGFFTRQRDKLSA